MIERLIEAERALSVGLLDQAEHLYQQAWEADPHNSIAVAGLARVALERGDEATAHALALRALEIDEDNPAARRIVDRLVDVQAARDAARTPPLTDASSAPERTRAERTRAEPTRAEPEPPKNAAAEKSRPAKPHVAPPAAIRTSSSGKRRTSPPPAASGPTLPKARPLSPPTPKPPPAERPPGVAPQPGPARPAAKRATPKPGHAKTGDPRSDDARTGDGKTADGKPHKEPGLLDRLFGPRH
jgi:hypothetical protein